MLADLNTTWRLFRTSVDGYRLGLAMLLILLASATDGLGLALLIPLLGSLGVESAASAKAEFAWLLPGSLSGSLPGILILFMAAIVLRAIVVQVRDLTLARIRLVFLSDLRVRIYSAIAYASWAHLRRKRSADFNAVLSSEIDRVDYGVHLALQAPARIAIIFAHLLLALLIAPVFSAVALALAAALAWGVRKRLFESRRLGEVLSDAGMRISGEISEFLQALKLTKSYGAEARHIRSFAEAVRHAGETTLAGVRLYAKVRLVQDTASAVCLAGLVWAGSRWAELPLASLLLLILIFHRVLPMFQDIQALAYEFVHSLSAFRAVATVIEDCEAAAERPMRATSDRLSFTRELRFEGVHFGYDDAHEEVLRGIDLVLPAGSLTVLSGVSGAGKSTILDLVGGLIAPTGGRILIDGIELTPGACRSWRQSIAYMTQEAFLFHDTIRANLSWANPAAGEGQFLDAIRQAGLTDLIHGLPLGLETVIGDRGANLSGGERQRLALARALLRTPRLMLLDEPASALDDENERRILQSIAALRGASTILLVTHSAQAIALADRHYRLENGLLVGSERKKSP